MRLDQLLYKHKLITSGSRLASTFSAFLGKHSKKWSMAVQKLYKTSKGTINESSVAHILSVPPLAPNWVYGLLRKVSISADGIPIMIN